MTLNPRGIRKWWAEYLESMGELEQAIQFYETAKDYYSLVRLLCFTGNLERAVEVVEESGSKAAAYQLARRLSMENVRVHVCGCVGVWVCGCMWVRVSTYDQTSDISVCVYV